MNDSKEIIIISASCGKNLELSQKFLEKSSEMKISSEILDLTTLDIPLFNPRIHSNANIPEKILKIKEKLFATEKWIICAPEYNGSIPPIITNAISWISTSTDYWRDGFLNKIALVATSSGGPGNKFLTSMKMQLEHLGAIVMPRFINISSSLPLKKDSAEKILKQFINLL